jgi:hypothetical protein
VAGSGQCHQNLDNSRCILDVDAATRSKRAAEREDGIVEILERDSRNTDETGRVGLLDDPQAATAMAQATAIKGSLRM